MQPVLIERAQHPIKVLWHSHIEGGEVKVLHLLFWTVGAVESCLAHRRTADQTLHLRKPFANLTLSHGYLRVGETNGVYLHKVFLT